MSSEFSNSALAKEKVDLFSKNPEKIEKQNDENNNIMTFGEDLDVPTFIRNKTR